MIEAENPPEERRLCANCVGEPYLSGEIKSEGDAGTCSFCGGEAHVYTLGVVADRLEGVFEKHFRRTNRDPEGWEYTAQKEGYWERDGEQTVYAILNLMDVSEEIAGALQSILGDRYRDLEADQMGEETEFSEEAHYEETGADLTDFHDSWRSFERSIQGEARFFSPMAEAVLSDLFNDVHEMKARGQRPAVREIGPNTPIARLHRARVFQSENRLTEALINPERYVGTPASRYAANGRMNARGVSVFYGATDLEVALAEVRPPVGSKVVTAAFEIIRPLYVLDVEALQRVMVRGSMFDPRFARSFNRAAFLNSLAARITMPIMPDGEATDYLVTQAMADYLANKVDPPLDGILYPSAQGVEKQFNVVLFHKASLVHPSPDGPGTRVTVNRWAADDEEPDYTVSKEILPRSEPALERADFPALMARYNATASQEEDWDVREPTLRLDRATLTVRHITRVAVSHVDYPVRSYEWSDADLNRSRSHAMDIDL
jgi:hypothetical protein